MQIRIRRSLRSFTEAEIRSSAEELRELRREADLRDAPLLNSFWLESGADQDPNEASALLTSQN